MTDSLRDKIETLVLTGFNHADEQGAYKICANEVIKEIEKRIDSIPYSNNFKGGIYTKESLQQVEKNTILRVKEILK